MSKALLHVFPFSNFCEKAAWALDIHGIPFHRQMYLPMMQARRIKKISGQTLVPVLEHQGKVIAGSAKIVGHLEELSGTGVLYPKDFGLKAEAIAWQNELDEFGPTVRAELFYWILADKSFAFKTMTAGKSGLAVAAYRPMFKMMSPILKKKLKQRVPDQAVLRATVMKKLDKIAEATASSGYLVGNTFSVADLTAASIIFPLFLPNSSPASSIFRNHESGVRWLEEWDKHPAKSYVERIYQSHR